MNTPKPFRLAISNNTTGEVLQELDFDALLGAAHVEEGLTATLIVTECDAIALAETTSTLKRVFTKTYKDHPEILLAEGFIHTRTVESAEENEI